jgi:hypothetical protein
MGKGLKGSSYGLIKEFSQNFLGATEENEKMTTVRIVDVSVEIRTERFLLCCL